MMVPQSKHFLVNGLFGLDNQQLRRLAVQTFLGANLTAYQSHPFLITLSLHTLYEQQLEMLIHNSELTLTGKMKLKQLSQQSQVPLSQSTVQLGQEMFLV
jgi:hypothetical protein